MADVTRELRPGVRVRVGPVMGEVIYTQRVGCCGGISVAVKLDTSGQIIYVKPNETRLVDAEVGHAKGPEPVEVSHDS